MEMIDLLAERMRYLQQMQKVISRNVANSDMPGYKAETLSPFRVPGAESPTLGQKLQPAVTNSNHLNSNGVKGKQAFAETRATAYETIPSGNNVVLEEQMVRLAENNADYQMVTNLYRKTNSLMKMALGKAN